jgi:hypothetical protein
MLQGLKDWMQLTQLSGPDDWMFASPVADRRFYFRAAHHSARIRKMHGQAQSRSRSGSLI